MHCSKYGGAGHKRTTCKVNIDQTEGADTNSNVDQIEGKIILMLIQERMEKKAILVQQGLKNYYHISCKRSNSTVDEKANIPKMTRRPKVPIKRAQPVADQWKNAEDVIDGTTKT